MCPCAGMQDGISLLLEKGVPEERTKAAGWPDADCALGCAAQPACQALFWWPLSPRSGAHSATPPAQERTHVQHTQHPHTETTEARSEETHTRKPLYAAPPCLPPVCC